MAHHKELVDELIQFLDRLQGVESANGATGLILKYGRDFRTAVNTPPWLQVGEPHQCFSNAAKQAIIREDVFYAEGYAFEPELPIPVQHAWLVNSDGWVIDPTWKTTKGHVYFGMAFSRRFVTKMLGKTKGEAGILVNLHLLRRQFRLFEHLKEEMETGLIKVGGSLNQRPVATYKLSQIEYMSRLSMCSRNAGGTEEGFILQAAYASGSAWPRLRAGGSSIGRRTVHHRDLQKGVQRPPAIGRYPRPSRKLRPLTASTVLPMQQNTNSAIEASN